jgi:IclR family pca regulon transcriptional regulator
VPFGLADSEPRPGESAARPGNVRALERGLAIITAFDAKNADLTLSDVAKTTGLPRAVVRRFLYTVLQLGYAYLSSFGLPQLARIHLEELVTEIDESVALGVLDDTDMVYVARVPSKRLTAVSVNVGKRFPAHATSMGRVLLAGQPKDWLDEYFATTKFTPLTPETTCDPTELRELVERAGRDGWALVDQELEVGLRAIAVPIHDDGDVVAAVNVSVHADRNDGEIVAREMVPKLQNAARAIERDLEMSPRR